MTTLCIDNHSDISDALMSSISDTMQNLNSLLLLSIIGFYDVSMPQLVQFGAAVSRNPRLESVTFGRRFPPAARYGQSVADLPVAKAFFDSCGFHPRLREVHLWFSCSDEIDRRLNLLHSNRAKVLTALVAASRLARVGGSSPAWKVPLDIFRRLHGFLDSSCG